MSDLSRVEQLLRNTLGEDIYEVTPQSRVEALLVELNELIEGMGGDPITDVTDTEDMTDTEKIYRYNGSIYYYNGTAWVTQNESGDSDFFVVEVTANWWTDPPSTTANCTWSELTATTKPILWNGQIARSYYDISGRRIAYMVPAPSVASVYEVHELVFEATGYTVTENTYTINTSIVSAMLNIAPLYSEYLTYNVGDLVIYNNALYQCTTAVSAPESFNYSKWTSTNIASVIASL